MHKLVTVALITTIFAALSLSLEDLSYAQSCSDGSAGDFVLAGANEGVVNTYYSAPIGEFSLSPGASSVPVDSNSLRGAGDFVEGDTVLIIQMQGASIDTGNERNLNGSYGDGPGGLDRQGVLRNQFFSAGRYEFNRAAGPIQNNELPLVRPTRYTYVTANPSAVNDGDAGLGVRRYQVIRVPRYRNISIGGILQAEPWNGRSGGVVVLDAQEQLVIQGQGRISATGMGFRGGSPIIPTVEDIDDIEGLRGEGIAGTPSRAYSRLLGLNIEASGYFGQNADTGRGAPGNGGGNADIADSGGGGGGGGSPGGDGGVGRLEIGPDLLPPNQARGGAGFSDFDRLFLGGGGGSGQLDDPTLISAVSGQTGGGIILLRAPNITGQGSIDANGDDGLVQTAEGSGGGGGGGTIVIYTRTNDLRSLSLNTVGGTGVSTGTLEDAGGGGGGGGRVLVTHPQGQTIMFSAAVMGGTGGGAPELERVGTGGIDGTSTFEPIPPPDLRCVAPDSDGDGVDDELDLDDDNDGIPDTIEGGGVDPSLDTDTDGIPDDLDPDSAGFIDANADGVDDRFDADGDGIPNRLDLDSDNDGRNDLTEGGGLDTNDDGRIDAFTDTNNNGLDDQLELSPLPVPDTDGDDTPDFLDPDDDGDSIFTIFEPGDTDQDGIPDALDDDDDNDGRPTISESPDPNGDGNPDDAVDGDNDGIPSYLDPFESDLGDDAGVIDIGIDGGIDADAGDADGGLSDVGIDGGIGIDTGAADGSLGDSGPQDLGEPDAGTPDIGLDTGASDAGGGSDSGEDAGIPDGGGEDAGPLDGGELDGGGENDAGPLDGGERDGGEENDAGPLDGGELDGGGENDAGPRDGGERDGGGENDAGPLDGGERDGGGENDAGPLDGGERDGGGENDAGPSDAGENDAGTPDDGGDAEVPDSNESDASEGPDAGDPSDGGGGEDTPDLSEPDSDIDMGPPDQGPSPDLGFSEDDDGFAGGGGCSATPPSTILSWLLLLPLIWFKRRSLQRDRLSSTLASHPKTSLQADATTPQA